MSEIILSRKKKVTATSPTPNYLGLPNGLIRTSIMGNKLIPGTKYELEINVRKVEAKK